jgi:L-arabinose isomerase
MNNPFNTLEAWFVTGSQHLYGEETLREVADDSQQMVSGLNASSAFPVKIVYKPVLTTPESIYKLCLEANSAANCIGLVTWMHTFSPAKMWIAGLKALQKPLAHLHTQYNRDIPWSSIDMDFMNLNQSAHGGREFGFINTRMRINRKVIVGHWEDENTRTRLNVWLRVAAARHELQHLKIARFGDNMRQVAVTEGDKVSAQIKFGFETNGYGLGDLAETVRSVDDSAIYSLVNAYEEQYELTASLRRDGSQRQALMEAAKIEAGMRTFLERGGFMAFTDTFEDLHGLDQLPGLAVQRLMADGYGFGAEGDWKTAALVRAIKVMGYGLPGGSSFMEDYTYHFSPGNHQVLGAHMLEICPSIASGQPTCEIHPLGIGGKSDPVRLVFNSPAGPALNASLIDMGNRFRLLVNEVEAVDLEEEMPKLPVARVLWKPAPDLQTAASAWILAGGAHHTCYSQAINTEYMEDLADMLDVELVVIDSDTRIRSFKNELRWSEGSFAGGRG